MKRRYLAIAAICIVATAAAQQPPANEDKGKAERNAAAQKNLKSATEGTVKGYGGAAADGSAKAASSKSQPRTAPDAAAKQEAVKSATAGTAKGYGGAAAEGAAAAAKDKSARPAPLKPKADTPEMRKVVP